MAIFYDREDHVVTNTIDRPEKMNALDPEAWLSFANATKQLEQDDAAWVGIITGAGPRAFSAGATKSLGPGRRSWS
jgi:enoyl-CoA hydratase/carnithine racemase